jgi:hypothetical protein
MHCTGPLVSNRIHGSAAWLSEIEAVGFRRFSGRYAAWVSAPSTMRLVPEMRLATGLARNTAPAYL